MKLEAEVLQNWQKFLHLGEIPQSRGIWYRWVAPPLVPLVRVESHSLGLGVSISPLVELVRVR